MRWRSPRAGRWVDLRQSDRGASGYAFVYYSDDLSRLAVRFVTKVGDNKSDPNLETGTFGLFSTCGRAMRSGIVRRGYPYIFFVTNRRPGRALAGYYRVRWYADGVFAAAGDYCLAADRVRFIDPAISLSEVRRVGGVDLTAAFRSCRLLDPADCQRLARLLESRPDATDLYVREIDRLERFNAYHTGFRYVAWRQRQPFTWRLARAYMRRQTAASADSGGRNSSPSGSWRCRECRRVVRNLSLLKRCPMCGALGSLRPHS